VLILKVVKVLCFDTLLQVFILKVLRVAVSVFPKSFASDDKSTPSVFCKKSADLLDSKGDDFFGGNKEFVTV
jgi:hypothetical protein